MEEYIRDLEKDLDVMTKYMIERDQFKNVLNDIKIILYDPSAGENHTLLIQLLKINLVLMSKWKSQRIDCDVRCLLRSVEKTVEDRSIIYDLVLLTVLNKETNGVVEDLLGIRSTDLLYLEVLEGVIDGLIMTGDEFDVDMSDVVKLIESDEKYIYKKIINDVIPKYCSYADGGELLGTIANGTNDVTLLDIACGLGDLFIPVLIKKDGFVNEVIFKYLVHGTFTEKKKCLYILDKIVQNRQKYKASREFRDVDAWRNFIVISETISEKQYHLVQPTFKLVQALNTLNETWRLCIIAQYLNHPHKEIVRYTIKKILQNEWDYDMKLLVNSLNNSFVFDNNLEIVDHLNSFLNILSTDKFVEFVDLYATIKNPNPYAAYFVVNLISQHKINFNKSLSEKLIDFTKEIKHVFIKRTVQFSIVRFVTNMTTDNLIEFVSIIDYIYEKNICKKYVQTCIRNMFESHPNKTDLYNLIETNMSDYVPLIFLVYNNKDVYSFQKAYYFMESDSVSYLRTICEILTIFHTNVQCTLIFKDTSTKKIMLKFFYDYLQKFIVKYDESFAVDLILKLPNVLFKCLPKEYVVELLNRAKKHDKFAVYLIIWKLSYYNTNLDESMLSIKMAVRYIEDNNVNYIRSHYNAVKCYITIPEEDVVEKLNDILDKQHDVSGEIISAVQILLGTRYRINSDQAYAEKIKNLLQRCVDDLFYKGTVAVLQSDLIKLLFTKEIVLDNVLKEVLISFVERIYENNCEDYSSLRNSFIQIYNLLNLSCDVEMEILISLCDYIIIEPLLCVPLLRKDQRLEYEVVYEVEDEQKSEQVQLYCSCNDDIFYLYNCKCVADTDIRLVALHLTLDIHERVEMRNFSNFIIRTLLFKYRETFMKRYFPNSQLHLKKLSILQHLNISLSYLLKTDNEIIDELHTLVFDALSAEAHQSSTKILLQWLLSNLLYGISEKSSSFNDEMNDLVNNVDELKGQNIGNFFPVIYHLSKRCSKEVVHEAMKFLLEHSMGPCFNLRYIAQLTFIYIQNYWKLSEYEFQYESITAVLEQTKISSIQDPFNLAFLNIIGPDSEFMSLETIYYHLPRLTGVEKVFWCQDIIKKCKYLSLHDVNVASVKDDLTRLESSVSSSTRTELDDASMNIQRKIETWGYEDDDGNYFDGDLIVVASLIDRLPNLGGLSRTCEIFGVKKYVLNNSLIVKNNEYKNLSMSSEKWVEIEEVKINNLGEYLKQMKKYGYNIVGVEQTTESQKLNEYKFQKKTILVLGSEREGIPANLIPLMDICLEIPQFGQIRSLNVHVAGALFIWEYTKQFCDF